MNGGEEVAVSRRIRLALVLIGVALLLFSLAALVYAGLPAGGAPAQDHAPLVPTLFVPPP